MWLKDMACLHFVAAGNLLRAAGFHRTSDSEVRLRRDKTGKPVQEKAEASLSTPWLEVLDVS